MIAGSIHRLIFLVAGLVLALTTDTNAQANYQPGVGFAMVGIATGQSARVNALNQGNGSPAQDSSCRVTLQFLDAQGTLLKQAIVTLRRGKAASVDLSGDAIRGDSRRVQIRAVLLFGYFGGAPPGPGALERFDCNIVPSLEIYDNQTGRTSLVVTDTKPLPPPTTPAQ